MAHDARLLDLTRLAGRAARMLTGVDRVERAYLQALLADSLPCFALVRTAAGYLLLDRAGMAAFEAALDARLWPAPRAIDRLLRRGDPGRAGVERFLRNRAVARSTRGWLGRMLARHLPPRSAYLNVGQTTLRSEVLAALRAVPGARVAVMIHDTIPLDHPHWQRPESAAALDRRLALAARHADQVIATSRTAAEALRPHLARHGRVPPVTIAHLGVAPAAPDPAALPPGLDLAQPYFVSVSTIEPRKNHALLLDTWELLGPDAPWLYLVGGQGWLCDDVMARLAARPPRIRHLEGLEDGAVAALVRGAKASLNPTRAEGFGLPALEAAALGVPVVCGDLAIWRELLGDRPIYAGPDDRYLWAEIVMSLARPSSGRAPAGGAPAGRAPVPVPGWPAHFKTVLTAI